MTIELHELHRRRLTATVQLIENGLDRIERTLTKSRRSNALRDFQDTLETERRNRLLRETQQLRSSLEAFASRFGLKLEPLDIRQILNADLASIWVMLENCRPKRMKGYGVEFAEAARKSLESSIEQLLEQVNGLRQLIP